MAMLAAPSMSTVSKPKSKTMIVNHAETRAIYDLKRLGYSRVEICRVLKISPATYFRRLQAIGEAGSVRTKRGQDSE